jgi:hypothetical protein
MDLSINQTMWIDIFLCIDKWMQIYMQIQIDILMVIDTANKWVSIGFSKKISMLM